MNISQNIRSQMNRYFDQTDIFLKSFSEYLPDEPLFIHAETELFEVYKGYRDAYKFEIICKVHPNGIISESNKKKVIKFSAKNSSYLKLIERFGLSQEAKRMYQGLDVYAIHFTGQANLTALRWEQNQIENPIVAYSDFGKDLIFRGAPITGSQLMNLCGVQLYKSMRKDDEYVVTYRIENHYLGRKAHCFKIIKSIDLLLGLNDQLLLENQLEKFENYWDCDHVF